MHADHREDVTEIRSGDIGAVLGFKESFTGDTLCDTKALVLETISFPEPVISIAIEPKSTADQEKMGEALRKLSEEDPTLHVHTDEDSGQTILRGMGELASRYYCGSFVARIQSAGKCRRSTCCLPRIDHQTG